MDINVTFLLSHSCLAHSFMEWAHSLMLACLMSLHECTWMYMNVHECAWMCMNVHECAWMCMNAMGDINDMWEKNLTDSLLRRIFFLF